MDKSIFFIITSIFSLPIVPFNVSNGPIDDTLIFNVNSSKYGPYKIGDKDKTIYIYYSANKDLYVNEYFGIGFKQNNYTTNILYESKIVRAKSETSFKFNLPISTYLTERGMYCCFRIIDTNTSTDLYRKDFVIYPSSFNNINIDEYRLTNYQSNPIQFEFVSGEIITHSESFIFSEMKNYVDIDFYHYLPISNMGFSSSSQGLTFTTLELIFDDKKNVFPYFKKQTDGLIHLDLQLNYLNNLYTFRFKKTMYVDPLTLEMRNTLSIGNYIATNQFYFPINKKDEVNGYIFTINCKELGNDKISFSYDMDYFVDLNYFGPCNNSEFCIKGDVGND